MLTHFSLFTGIGGADIAAEWAGFESIGQVEWADYPTKVLEKHWPDVPRWRDIRDVRANDIRPIIGSGGVTVLSGGFPCQPFSVAGKRKGKDDDRFLWPEMLRVIRELQPSWVIGENVNGFVNMGLEDACSDLENEGYAVQAFVIPACAVQAWHERKRVFIVAYSKHNRGNASKISRENNGTQSKESTRQKLLLNESERTSSLWSNSNIDRRAVAIFQDSGCELWEGSEQLGKVSDENRERNANIVERPSQMVSNSNGIGWEKSNYETRNISERKSKWESFTTNGTLGQLWESEPNVGGRFDGFSNWLDGNLNLLIESHKCIMSNGNILIGGIENGSTEERNTRKILRTLWDEIREESIQRDTGRYGSIQEEKILFTYLCKLEKASNTLYNISSESPEIQERLLRIVWDKNEFTSPPHRPESREQRRAEYTDTLQTLSRLLAHHSKEAWEEYCRQDAKFILNRWDGDWEKGIPRVANGISSRVDRLKCLGNAIVPQQIYPIFQAIADIERGVKA